jgi:YD repeat-containing protein
VHGFHQEPGTTYQYDGLGRPIRTARTFPGAGCVEQVTTYDGPGQTNTRSPWRACGSSSGATEFRYDALGRVISVATPDNQVTHMGYAGSRLVDRTVNISGKDTRTREEYDVFHRLILVTENANGALPQRTSYAYDAGDRLTAVAMSSPAGTQTRKFTYDNRGFLLSETHPELGANGYGTASYQNLNAAIEDQRGYDSRGHSHYAQTGSRITTFEYDAAERLLRERDGASRLLKELAYDSGYGCDAPQCLGKLAAAARYHYDASLGDPAVSEGYRYDPATGKPQTRCTTAGTTSFILSQTYNTLGAIDTIRYPCHTPDSAGCDAIHDFTVKNTYTNGLLTKVGTPASLSAFSSGISYHPSGIVNTVNHSNGAFESWSADAVGRPGG